MDTNNFFKDKKIFISGGAGTIGKALAKELLLMQPAEIRIFDNNETELFFLSQQFNDPMIKLVLGDLRDKDALIKGMDNVDIVFHAGAFKHVPLCEENPFEAVKTNILGVQNIIEASIFNNVSRVIYTSSDKAVNPTSVMGTSKLMGEQLINAANYASNNDTIFSSTRFGNVLGSRGSVIPLFKEQIKKGGPITLTDENMTRFIMSLHEAVLLLLKSATLAKGGEVFITKMSVANLPDIIEIMIKQLASRFGHKIEDIEIKIIGKKPGEKIFEELMNSEETRRSIELQNHYVVLPALKRITEDVKRIYPDVISENVSVPYNSENHKSLSVDELEKYLGSTQILK